jgi:2-polyprenyl-3-methyl-5-hydroxy-6-metoxy-1,4-benzoquinol methylase
VKSFGRADILFSIYFATEKVIEMFHRLGYREKKALSCIIVGMESNLAAEHAREVASGERFEFGRNWNRFLSTLNDERIALAEESLRAMLGVSNLDGLSFVDVGSGSGLFSLAARRLGAKVHSLDYDPHSVACTAEMRKRYAPDDPEWSVEQGSALDPGYLKSLGQFDIVYSWGVLHHTGAMWNALEKVSTMVRSGGHLFIAIYNDQGKTSRRWATVKRAYNKLPPGLRFIVLWPAFGHLWWRRLLKDALTGRPLQSFRTYQSLRGMSLWWDVVDWVGGYPFEVARPEEIFDFYRARGFILERMKTEGGSLGCNEFVFRRA